MYGKHFASMYTGSMVGSGAMMFALMGYVLSNMKPDRNVGMQVELNPKLLTAILGEDQKEIEKTIEKLCSPDAQSRSKEEEGRRLVKIGQFDYRVVNGLKYRSIRNEEERRTSNRLAKSRERMKAKLPAGGRRELEEAAIRGAGLDEIEKIYQKWLPEEYSKYAQRKAIPAQPCDSGD